MVMIQACGKIYDNNSVEQGVLNVISATEYGTPIEVAVTCEVQGNIPQTVRIMIIRTSKFTPLS